MCSALRVVTLASLMVTMVLFVSPVYASPVVVSEGWYSQPTARTVIGTAWTTPANAHDKKNDTSASINYGTALAGYLEVRTFKTQLERSAPYPWIKQVDFKLRYSADANTDVETYKIDYLIIDTATLNVNGREYDASWDSWASAGRVGTSPWIDAADYPTNYIQDSAKNKLGNFLFPDLGTYAGSPTFTVTLYIKCWGDGGDGLNVYMYDGSAWSSAYAVTPENIAAPGNYKTVDLSAFLTTATKINAAKMRLEKTTSGSANPVGADHAYLSVSITYTVSLQAATRDAYALNTRVWPAQINPKTGTTQWTWADIASVRIRVTLSGAVSPITNPYFYWYEAWLTVVIKSAPKLYVSPASIIDTSKTIGSRFSVDIKVENISNSFGYEFKLRYDPKVLNATGSRAGTFFPTYFSPPWTNQTDYLKGIVWISITRASGDQPCFGSGTYITIDFKVTGLGETTLNLYSDILGNPEATAIPHDTVDGYFRNIATPFGATLKVVAPGDTQTAPFTIDINITKSTGQSGPFGVYSWEFNLTYDKTLLTATLVTEGAYLKTSGTTTFQKTINDAQGWVWANATLNGDLPGVWGNGTIATIDFNIDASGTSYLNFVAGEARLIRLDYGAAVPFPTSVSPVPPFYDLPVTTIDGSVTVSTGVPEFPLGAALEIALIPMIIFVWLKSKRRKTFQATNLPH